MEQKSSYKTRNLPYVTIPTPPNVSINVANQETLKKHSDHSANPVDSRKIIGFPKPPRLETWVITLIDLASGAKLHPGGYHLRVSRCYRCYETWQFKIPKLNGGYGGLELGKSSIL